MQAKRIRPMDDSIIVTKRVEAMDLSQHTSLLAHIAKLSLLLVMELSLVKRTET